MKHQFVASLSILNVTLWSVAIVAAIHPVNAMAQAKFGGFTVDSGSGNSANGSGATAAGGSAPIYSGSSGANNGSGNVAGTKNSSGSVFTSPPPNRPANHPEDDRLVGQNNNNSQNQNNVFGNNNVPGSSNIPGNNNIFGNNNIPGNNIPGNNNIFGNNNTPGNTAGGVFGSDSNEFRDNNRDRLNDRDFNESDVFNDNRRFLGDPSSDQSSLVGFFNTVVNDFNFLELVNLSRNTIRGEFIAIDFDGREYGRAFAVAPQRRADFDLHSNIGDNRFGHLLISHSGRPGDLVGNISQYGNGGGTMQFATSQPLQRVFGQCQ